MRRAWIACGVVFLLSCGSDDDAGSDAGTRFDAGDASMDGADANPDAHPLEHLQPTADLTLSPGNVDGQDEDPTVLRARDGTLYVAWYSNRNGMQDDGLEDREVFLMRSADGATWTRPPAQITRHPKYAFFPSLVQDDAGGEVRRRCRFR